MTAIGETLRRERIRRDLDLETISRELKISTRFLQAIEDEKFDRLPGGVFAKAFVRQYAKLLGLDEDEMANEVQRLLQPATEVPQFTQTAKVDAVPIAVPRVEEWETVGDGRRFQWSSSLPALALVVVVMMGCAGVYSWWQRTRHTVSAHEAAPATVTAPPQVTPQAAPDTNAPVQASIPDQPQANPAAAAASTPRPEQSAARTEPAPPVTTAAAPNPPAGPPGPVHVELVALEPVWVLARSDGKYSFSGTIDANQTRIVDGNSTVILRLGNAGGVNITLNGKQIGPVGPKGQIRTVQLTSGGFEIVAAPKPPSAPLDLR